LVLVLIRPSMASLSSWAIFPFSTFLVSIFVMFLRPRSTNSSLMSFMITRRPLIAATWAIPFPIWPAPTTPKVFISIRVSSFSRCLPLDHHRHRFPASKTQGNKPRLLIGTYHFMEQGDQKAAAARPYRMTHGDAAPCHVYFGGIQFQLFHHAYG